MTTSDKPSPSAPETPAELYRSFDYYARKSLGQHFLIDSQILHEIVTLADIRSGERVLEIGPGCGTLTLVLLQRGAEVDAVEIDDNAVEYLKEQLEPHFPFRIHGASALDFDFESLFETTPLPWKVVANLPYNVGTKILFRLLEQSEHIDEMTLMFQKEVAHRIVAEPGDSDYGFLTVMAQLYADVHLAMTLPPGAFEPAPKVDSAVVQFRPLDNTRIEDQELRDAFEKVARAGFQARRKTLANGLKGIGVDKKVVESILEQLELKKKIRPQRVSFEQFVTLAKRLLEEGELDQ